MYYIFVRTRHGTVKRQTKRNKTLKIKGTVMEVEKALINNRLRVSKVPRKFRI